MKDTWIVILIGSLVISNLITVIVNFSHGSQIACIKKKIERIEMELINEK